MILWLHASMAKQLENPTFLCRWLLLASIFPGANFGRKSHGAVNDADALRGGFSTKTLVKGGGVADAERTLLSGIV